MTDSTANDGGPLSGMHALVTGGGTGIGLGCAQRLATDGATVTICGRRRDVLDAAVAAIGGSARAVTADVTVEDDVAAAVAAASEPGRRGSTSSSPTPAAPRRPGRSCSSTATAGSRRSR